jgi:hypothetical protein
MFDRGTEPRPSKGWRRGGRAALVVILAAGAATMGAGLAWRARPLASPPGTAPGDAGPSVRLAETPAQTPAPTILPPVARRETRPTLDPARFVGRAAAAHRVARDPDVLDQLYCYCGCDKLVGHRSLLSCYTDSHAAT